MPHEIVTASEILSKTYPEQLYWIGPALLPRPGRMLLTGETGTGKSVVSLHTSVCLISKQPLFNAIHRRKDENFGKPFFEISDHARVLYIDYEIPEQMRQTRLKPMLAGIDPQLIKNLTFSSRSSIYGVQGDRFRSLDALIKEQRPDVLVIDPLSNTHELDENSNEIKLALNAFDRLIELYGLTIVVNHHSSTKVSRNQQGGIIVKKAQEMPRGHSSLMDWADLHIHLEDISDKHLMPLKKSEKLLSIQFGKTRYSRRPIPRKVKLDWDTLQFEYQPGDE